MRFNSAVLFLSTLCGHLSLNAVAAPIRIVVVEKVAISDSDAFLRSVRVGLAGTGAIPADITGDSIRFDGPPKLERDSFAAIPMNPDAEFNILPFPNPLIIDQQSKAMREFCRKERKSWKVRCGRLSNWVREKMGLPVVRELSPCHPGILQLPVQSSSLPPLGAPKYASHNVITPANDAGMTTSGYRFRRPGMWAARHRRKDFSGRLQRALYSLSPWEGRALAFVVGCGLGVLVRMLVVFIILGTRALRSRSQSIELPEDEREQVVEGVILFDAGSIKAASQEDLTLYNEK